MSTNWEAYLDKPLLGICEAERLLLAAGVKLVVVYDGCRWSWEAYLPTEWSNNQGFFVDDRALEAAIPVGETGWFATVISTGTIWVRDGSAWVDTWIVTNTQEWIEDVVGGMVGDTATIELVYTDWTGSLVANSLVFDRDDGTNTVTLVHTADTLDLSGATIETTTSSITDIRQDVRAVATATDAELVTELGIRDAIDAAIGTVDSLQEITDLGNTTDNDIEITDTTKGIILVSPDATRYRITVANGGTLSVTAV